MASVLLLAYLTAPWSLYLAQRFRPHTVPDEAPAAFQIGAREEPMPFPEPGDWPVEHPELGQTFDDYMASSPKLARGARRTIVLRPVGAWPDDAQPLEAIRAYVALYFQLPTRIGTTLDAEAHGVASRVHPQTGKPQWLTGDLLEALKGELPEDAACVLGVTHVDLWPGQGWSFVFGQASLRDRVGVFSLARHDPAFFGQPRPPDVDRLMARRNLKVITHELGHVFGLHHCPYFRCNMNGSNTLDEADGHPLHMCPICLRKLHHATAFDPQARAEGLERWHRAQGVEARR